MIFALQENEPWKPWLRSWPKLLISSGQPVVSILRSPNGKTATHIQHIFSTELCRWQVPGWFFSAPCKASHCGWRLLFLQTKEQALCFWSKKKTKAVVHKKSIDAHTIKPSALMTHNLNLDVTRTSYLTWRRQSMSGLHEPGLDPVYHVSQEHDNVSNLKLHFSSPEYSSHKVTVNTEFVLSVSHQHSVIVFRQDWVRKNTLGEYSFAICSSSFRDGEFSIGFYSISLNEQRQTGDLATKAKVAGAMQHWGRVVTHGGGNTLVAGGVTSMAVTLWWWRGNTYWGTTLVGQWTSTANNGQWGTRNILTSTLAAYLPCTQP